jgi:translation initiation factor 3 subunit I
VLTGAGDDTVKLWDCELGKEVRNWNTASAVRTCAFTHLGDLIMFTTDERSATPCELFVYDLRANEDPITVIPMETNRKVTAALWGPLDQFIVTGHADGSICHYDHKVSKCIKQVREHKEAVSDLQLNHDMTMIISSSKDTTAMLYDVDDLKLIKTFRTDRPANSAAISPIKDHVVVGGGQEAMEVTTTTTKAGKFEAKFFHIIYEEEIGRVKGHFGPINSLKFHPDGKSFSSGGEDGYVRVHYFDSSYFDFEFEF